MSTELRSITASSHTCPVSIVARAKFHLLIKPGRIGMPTIENPHMVNMAISSGIFLPTPLRSDKFLVPNLSIKVVATRNKVDLVKPCPIMW